MRILSVHNSSDIYGASRCIERLAKRLNQDGHSLFVVLPRPGPLSGLLEAAGAKVIFHPGLSVIQRSQMQSLSSKVTFALRLPLSVLWITLLILRLRIDVVHTNCSIILSSAFAAFLSRRPHIWHVRECFTDFPSLWKYYQYLIHRFSRTVIAISQTVKRQFATRLQEKVSLVYDGLPREEFEPCSTRTIDDFRNHFEIRGLSAAVVGRIKWLRKGQEVFVRAVALLKTRYPDAKFLIVGSAAPGNEDHAERLHQLVEELDVGTQIIFTGDIDDVRPVFASVDVVVVPSVQPEPLGLVVMESMAMGTPVVGSRSGGIAEQVTDGVDGCLFEPGDEAELARAMDLLFGDPVLRRKMATSARETFLSHFELEQSYLQFLQACVTPQVTDGSKGRLAEQDASSNNPIHNEPAEPVR